MKNREGQGRRSRIGTAFQAAVNAVAAAIFAVTAASHWLRTTEHDDRASMKAVGAVVAEFRAARERAAHKIGIDLKEAGPIFQNASGKPNWLNRLRIRPLLFVSLEGSGRGYALPCGMETGLATAFLIAATTPVDLPPSQLEAKVRRQYQELERASLLQCGGDAALPDVNAATHAILGFLSDPGSAQIPL